MDKEEITAKVKNELDDLIAKSKETGESIVDVINSRVAELRQGAENAVDEQIDRVKAAKEDAEDDVQAALDKINEEYQRIENQARALRAKTLSGGISSAWKFAKDNAKRVALVAGAMLLAVGLYTCSGSDTPEPAQQPSAVVSEAPAGPNERFGTPVREAGDYAQRVFYRSGGTAEWGTLCEYNGGFVSVAHVTNNGVPKNGPTTAVTYSNDETDFSVLGIDVASIDRTSIPAMRDGDKVYTAGFPAGDRDGEVQEATVLFANVDPGRTWITLDPVEEGIAEGYVGGQSGSCVLNEDFEVVAVVHANSFSTIAGTENAHALVVPLDYAIAEAQGTGGVAPVALVDIPTTRPTPTIQNGVQALPLAHTPLPNRKPE